MSRVRVNDVVVKPADYPGYLTVEVKNPRGGARNVMEIHRTDAIDLQRALVKFFQQDDA